MARTTTTDFDVEGLILELLIQAEARPEGVRRGQDMFNRLCVYAPRLSEQVRGTELDPFYDDDRIPDFLKWILKQARVM